MLGLYLHIPFCQAICGYCNFNRGLFDGPLKIRYVDALSAEIAASDHHGAADTIFFGGGTPSLLDPPEVARLIAACRDAFDVAPGAEITLETNPETATPERLDACLEAGVNRISFGVQSFDDDELARLGRIHSAARAKEAIGDARASGFTNLSFDLMFWLPGQSLASWQRTVEEAVALAPDHLSLYLLELYPNAPLKETMARAAAASAPASVRGTAGDLWRQAADDVAADMYLSALERLETAGLRQYEISNVARPGFASRHNVKYWQSGDWLGFGCGAHSTCDGVRWKNVASTSDYVDRVARRATVRVDEERLSPQSRLEEALFTGLRLTEGIDEGNFRERFGVDPWTRYGGDLQAPVEAGLVWRRSGRFGLTRPGMLVANDVLSVFV